MARRLIGGERFDDADTDEVYNEIERLTDVIFVMDDATRLLRRACARWSPVIYIETRTGNSGWLAHKRSRKYPIRPIASNTLPRSYSISIIFAVLNGNRFRMKLDTLSF
jgi:hypothetical protein